MHARGDWGRSIRHWIGGPFIWGIIIPVAFADICLEIYHRICFPLYGLSYVPRRRYIRIIDRAKLPYLSIWGKLGCMYCGYVNGWLHYASAIAAETEKYWCAIKHAEDASYLPPAHEAGFAPYGDEKAIRE